MGMLALVACQTPTQLEPTEGDLVPEAYLSGETLRAEWALKGAYQTSPILEAPSGATRVGVLMETVEAGTLPQMEARGFDADGMEGEWVPLEITWNEDRQLVARADLGFDAYSAQLRVAQTDSVASILWSAVVPVPESEAAVEEIGANSAALRSDLAAVGVHSRSEWGARSGRGCSSNTSKTRMAIHHTVTPSSGDPKVRLRGIQNYHMDSNGWCDVGYHFLVSVDGRMWEGRPLGQLGTHVGNNNTGNVGISFIGCFQNSGCNGWAPATPPSVMLDGGATLVREISRIYGISINATNVKGHRDHSGATTSCPGDNLHRLLPEIRSRASAPTGPVWSAAYVNQTFPLARDPFVIPAGEERSGYLEMRNTGTDAWRPGQTFLGTTQPRDGASPIAGSDWVSNHRAATIDRVVQPGATGRFAFSVKAPARAGDYPQYFNLVQEGVAWFSPPGDDQIQIRVTSEATSTPPPPPPPPPADMGTEPVPDAGTPPPPPPMTDAGASMPDAGTPAGDAQPPTGDGSTTPLRMDPPVTDGCGCRTVGARDMPVLGWVSLALVMGARRRRRRDRAC